MNLNELTKILNFKHKKADANIPTNSSSIQFSQRNLSILLNKSKSNKQLDIIQIPQKYNDKSKEKNVMFTYSSKNLNPQKPVMKSKQMIPKDKQHLLAIIQDLQQKYLKQLRNSEKLLQENLKLRSQISSIKKSQQHYKQLVQPPKVKSQQIAFYTNQIQEYKKICFENQQLIRLLNLELLQKSEQINQFQKINRQQYQKQKKLAKEIQQKIQKNYVKQKISLQTQINYYINKITALESKGISNCRNCQKLGRTIILLNEQLNQLSPKPTILKS